MRLFYAERTKCAEDFVPCRKRKVYIVKGRCILGIVFLFTAIFLALFIYNTCYNSVIREKAKVKANYVAVSAINKAVEDKIKEDNLTYTDFTEITRKDDGSVASISIRSAAVNLFKSGLTNKILDSVTAYGKETIFMSPVAFMGYNTPKFLFKVPVVVIPVEILKVDLQSSFHAVGINQTKHELNLIAEVDVKLLLPIGSERFTVKTTVPLSQTIIVGSVPETYTNVEGVEDTGPDSILNLVP